jgi:hypothetical protein
MEGDKTVSKTLGSGDGHPHPHLVLEDPWSFLTLIEKPWLFLLDPASFQIGPSVSSTVGRATPGHGGNLELGAMCTAKQLGSPIPQPEEGQAAGMS